MKKIDVWVRYLFIIGIGIIWMIACLARSFIKTTLKANFVLSDIVIAFLSLVIIVLLIALCKKMNSDNNELKLVKNKMIFPICTLCVLFFQLIFSYEIYFRPNWDAGYIYSLAEWISDKLSLPTEVTDFLSYYPQDRLLFLIELMCCNVAKSLNVDGLYIIICLQCIISNVTGVLIFDFVSKYCGKLYGWISWGMYIIFLGFTTWLAVPYTDSLGIIFPILILSIFMKIKNCEGNKIFIYTILFVFITIVGYFCKPQAIFVSIACVLYYIIKKSNRKEWKRALVVLLCGISIVCGIKIVNQPINSLIKSVAGITIDNDKNLGMIHFLKIGCNEESLGNYTYEDYIASTSYSTCEERNKANLEIIKDRISNMNFRTIMTLCSKKIVTSFGDGTFFERQVTYGLEGGNLEYKDSISDYFRTIFLVSDEPSTAREMISLIKQIIWNALLAICTIGNLLLLKRKQHVDYEVEAVIKITLMGAFLFQIIFEASPRYIYNNVPILIVCTIITMKNCYIMLKDDFFI